MLIQPINSYNINRKTQTSFKNTSLISQELGYLSSKTNQLAEDILHGYRSVLAILERKTPEGLKRIAEEYPLVTIGENLIFHNCGEENNSIVINSGQSSKNKNLTYIARRKGSSIEDYKVLLDSFMLNNYNMLIKNFKQNTSKSFPKDKEYYTETEFKELNLEERLQKILEDFEPKLLAFRKYLAQNINLDNKLPDGELSFETFSKFNQCYKITDEIKEISKKISKKRLLKANQNFTDYKAISGLESFMFKDLGEEKVSITLNEFENKDGFNLKRLYIYDKNDKLLKTFLVVDNKKFVKNINQKTPNSLPEKFIYANSEEIEKDFLPEFEKYLTLYQEKLKEYHKYIEDTIKSNENGTAAEFNPIHSQILSEALNIYQQAKIKLRRLSPNLATKLKAEVENLKPEVGQTGFWINDTENNRIVQFLPINSNKHQNLIKISITNKENNEKKDYLIHDFKHIVKNYNPNYPTILPIILKYVCEDDIELSEVTSCFKLIKNKAEELANKADEKFEKRNIVRAKEVKIKKDKQEKDEYKKLIIGCKKEFEDAIKTADKDIYSFNKTMREIQEKINNYHRSHRN